MQTSYYKSNPELLIVDDEENVRVSLETALENDFKCRSVGTLQAALDVMSKKQFAVVIVDLVLPDGDGMDLLRQIKKNWPWTEVLIVTAVKKKEELMQCLEYGAIDYIIKPWNVSDLIRTLRFAAQIADLRRKLIIAQSKEPAHDKIPIASAAKKLDYKYRRDLDRLIDRLVGESHGKKGKKSNLLKQAREGFESRLILKTLQAHDWNQSETALKLGMPRNTLIKKMKRYRIPTTRQPLNFK